MEKGIIFNFGNKFLISIIFLSLLIGVLGNGLVLGQVFAKGHNPQNDVDTESIEIYPLSYKKSDGNNVFHNDKILSLKLQEQKQENTDLNTLSKSKQQKIAEKNFGEQEDDAIIMKGPVHYEEKEDYQKDMKNEDYGYEGKYSKYTSDEEARDDSNRDSDIDTSDEEARDDSNRDSDIDTSDEEARDDSNRDSDIDTSDEEARDDSNRDSDIDTSDEEARDDSNRDSDIDTSDEEARDDSNRDSDIDTSDEEARDDSNRDSDIDTSDEEARDDSNRDSDIDTSDEEARDDSNRDSDIDTSDEEARDDSNRNSDIDTSDEEARDSRDFVDDSKENHSNINDKNQSNITEKSNQEFKKIEEDVIENENSRLISEASQEEQISSDILPANINSKNKYHGYEILIANAGLDQSISKEERIVLDASNSFSKDNSITGFNWELIGDSDIEIDPSNLEVYTIDVPNHMKGNTLEFQLTVTNDDGLTDSDTVKVLINDEQDDDNDEQDDDNDEQDDDNDEQDDDNDEQDERK